MMRMYTRVGLLSLLLGIILTPSVVASEPDIHAKRPFQVLLVTDAAGLGSHGFNDLAWGGVRNAETRFRVRGSVLQAHSASEYVPLLRQAVRRGPNLIVAIGPSMASAVYQVATQYSQQKFVLVDATPARAHDHLVTMSNVFNIWFREQEAGYLAGVLAAWMEKARVGTARHRTIGYLGSLPTLDVNHYVAGYLAGARAVDRGITILGGYSHSTSDQDKARTIGLAQLAQGADILFGVAGESSRGYLQSAADKGAYGIGTDSNQAGLGSYILTSAVKRVDVAVLLAIRRSMTHSFVGGDHFFGLKEGAVGLAPSARSVPAWLRSRLLRDEKLIAQGRIVPPTVLSSR